MTDDERAKIAAEATRNANVENRLTNLENKMKWALSAAMGGAVYIAKAIADWYIQGGGPK